MDKTWKKKLCINLALLTLTFSTFLHHSLGEICNNELHNESVLDRDLKEYVDEVLNSTNFSVFPGLVVEKLDNVTVIKNDSCERGRSEVSLEQYVKRKVDEFTDTHVLAVNVEETARFLGSNPVEAATATTDSGKSSFMMGFGMGFLAFFLKKLLLPVFIGAQLVKSVLIAMFLPTILGGVGKLVGKGLSTFSGLSGASAGINNQQQQQVEDFEFKDADPYNNDPALGDDPGVHPEGTGLTLNTVDGSTAASTNSRLGFVNNQRVYSHPNINDNYYMRRPNKKTDYKVFHKIPSSSLLLTSYDPFYSPLLSRLDAVFQQLGLEAGKWAETERCRERLVCLMYANPAKYAPFSNLVSAQLSRELNELRKPSSDNPDILRFFRYMKAAKDGQDGEECLAHGGCPSLASKQSSPALLTTYNDINKLVQARKFQ